MKGNLFLRDWEVPKWTYLISRDLKTAYKNPGEAIDYAARDITPNQMISVLEDLGYAITNQESYSGWVHLTLSAYEKPTIWISVNALDMIFKWGIPEEEE